MEADRVQPALVLADRAVGLVASNNQAVSSTRPMVVGRDDEVEHAVLRAAGQAALGPNPHRGVLEDDDAVMLALWIVLRAGDPLSRDGLCPGAVGDVAAAGQHDPRVDNRVEVIRGPGAAGRSIEAVTGYLKLPRRDKSISRFHLGELTG